jgi:hypothetical protein
MFRSLIPKLADNYHVVATITGFGFRSPPRRISITLKTSPGQGLSLKGRAETIRDHVFDCAPVGLRAALAHRRSGNHFAKWQCAERG